jgi:predicted small integral membrane protein
MAARISKTLLVGSIGLLALVIVLNNLTDYNANFMYIQHVLSMDTVFPDSQLTWRAIASPPMQKLVYGAIIATESTITVLCLGGAVRLLQAIGLGGAAFNQAKATAVYGLTLAFVFWFVGFMVVAGEWFTMWQSVDWNGQQPAFRFIGCIGFVLLYLSLVDSDLPEGE